MPETPQHRLSPSGQTAPEALQARHVFVYGTLRAGEDNDINRLKPRPRLVGQASVPGTLYHLGRYPGLVLTGNTPVLGEIYRISPELERVLDEIEEIYPQQSDEYAKHQVPVHINGVSLVCLVYVINPSRLSGRPLIPGGDWVTGK